MSVQKSTPPALFSDNLFNTTLFPQTTAAGGNKQAQYANTSINGIDWTYADPEDQTKFINNLNAEIGRVIYGDAKAFDCLVDNMSYPVRYVVMHATAQTPSQAAHQLIVSARNVSSYTNTDWRSPPY